jgi:succinate-semialdehyde dehydrogenase / glutarate-semialdehyde dehydrogenase
MAIATTDPATGVIEQGFTAHDEAEIEHRIITAHNAFKVLKETNFAERAGWMNAAADALATDVENTARLSRYAATCRRSIRG